LSNPHSFPTRRSSDLYAIVGTDGIDEVHGATSQDEHEAQVTKLMMSRAAKTILVADSAKFDRRAFATVGGPEEFEMLVTDRGISEDRKSTRLNSSHVSISYAVFCLKKKKTYSR